MMPMTPMNCADIRTRLNDYLDGALSAAERTELERALEGCPDCRAELDALRKVIAEAKALPKTLDPQRDLWQGISEKIRAAPKTDSETDSKMGRAERKAERPMKNKENKDRRTKDRTAISLTQNSTGETAMNTTTEFLDTERLRGISYGALVLRKQYGRFLSRGVLGVLGVYLLGIAGYIGYERFQAAFDEEIPVVQERRIASVQDLQPPPPMDPQTQPPQPIAPVAKAPDVGTVKVVKDNEAPKQATLATQDVIRNNAGATGDSGAVGSGAMVYVPPPEPAVLESEEPADFTAVEIEPAFVNKVQPEYPEMAKKAGMEGKTIISVLVDKEGKPVKTRVLKGEEVFASAAAKAAMESSYTPAMQNGSPVKVWMTVPYSFKLK